MAPLRLTFAPVLLGWLIAAESLCLLFIAGRPLRAGGLRILRLLKGRRARAFRYRDHGALVSVREHFAAMDLMGLRMSGLLAWLL